MEVRKTVIVKEVIEADGLGEACGPITRVVAMAVVVEEGTIFTPETINTIREVTRRLDGVGFDSQSDARDDRRADNPGRARRGRWAVA